MDFYVLGDGLSVSAGDVGSAADAISTEGFEAEQNLPVYRTITGGYGAYEGVRGIAKAVVREENDTLIQITPEIGVPAPNYTFSFSFAE